MHAAEDDMVGVGTFGGVLGELEGVAHEVGMADDFIALVEVAEDQQFFAKAGFGCADAFLQFLVGGVTVFLREHLLAGGVARQRIEHGCAGSVARLGGVEMPWILGESGVAGALCAELGDDFVDGRRGECCSHAAFLSYGVFTMMPTWRCDVPMPKDFRCGSPCPVTTA